jgi:hypothetical protein
MSELDPVSPLDEAVIADIIPMGASLLEHDPKTPQRIAEDPRALPYLHTYVPEVDLMHIWGSEPDEEGRPVKLVINPGWGRPGSNRYSFWADSKVGKLDHAAWYKGGAKETLIEVSNSELITLAQEVSLACEALKLRLGLKN